MMVSVALGQPKMGLKQGRSVKSDGVLDEVNIPGGRYCFLFVLAPRRYDADMESLVARFLVLGVWMMYVTVFYFHIMNLDPPPPLILSGVGALPQIRKIHEKLCCCLYSSIVLISLSNS
jgi:hypothetical protein